MKYFTIILSLILFLTFQANSQIPDGYYDGTEGLSGEALKEVLHNIIKDHKVYQYTNDTTDVWDILKETDRDPDNEDNVILLYTGWSVDAAQEWNSGNGWSREHVWSKSHGDFGEDPAAGTDVHHLRPSDPTVNTAKNNRWFAESDEEYIDDDGATGCFYGPEWTWEPRPEEKGDVARMIFYMAVRYEGDFNNPDLELIDYLPENNNTPEPVYAKLSDLISWHNSGDDVSDWERNRNNIIYYDYQNNRNPFIDHPEWVDYIWGECNELTFSSVPVRMATENSEYQYNITFTGAEGVDLTISADNLPTWLTLTQENNTTAYLNGTPNEGASTVENILLELTDGSNTVSQNFTVTVKDEYFTAIMENNFDDCEYNGWTTYSISSSKNWILCKDNYPGMMYISAWDYSNNTPANDWLISPAVDFTSLSDAVFSFSSYTKYIDTDNYPSLKLKYSNDYIAEDNPENYSWTELSFNYPEENSQIWTYSGDIDLSGITGSSVYIALQYTSTGGNDNNCARWLTDDMFLGAVSESTGISLNRIADTQISISPNPFKESIELKYELKKNSFVKIEVFSVTGKKQKFIFKENKQKGKHLENLNLSDLPSGIFILMLSTEDKVFSEKIIKE